MGVWLEQVVLHCRQMQNSTRIWQRRVLVLQGLRGWHFVFICFYLFTSFLDESVATTVNYRAFVACLSVSAGDNLPQIGTDVVKKTANTTVLEVQKYANRTRRWLKLAFVHFRPSLLRCVYVYNVDCRYTYF